MTIESERKRGEGCGYHTGREEFNMKRSVEMTGRGRFVRSVGVRAGQPQDGKDSVGWSG